MPLHPCAWLDIWTDENVQAFEPPDEGHVDRQVLDLVEACFTAAKAESYTKKSILECCNERLDLYIDGKLRNCWDKYLVKAARD